MDIESTFLSYLKIYILSDLLDIKCSIFEVLSITFFLSPQILDGWLDLLFCVFIFSGSAPHTSYPFSGPHTPATR
jgi:hypothetical protein